MEDIVQTQSLKDKQERLSTNPLKNSHFRVIADYRRWSSSPKKNFHSPAAIGSTNNTSVWRHPREETIAPTYEEIKDRIIKTTYEAEYLICLKQHLFLGAMVRFFLCAEAPVPLEILPASEDGKGKGEPREVQVLHNNGSNFSHSPTSGKKSPRVSRNSTKSGIDSSLWCDVKQE